MDNGRSSEVRGQFDAIAKLPDAWDHNRQYQSHLLKGLVKCERALDIGCGTGELTRSLARYADDVVGIDVSRGMIDSANERYAGKGIRFIQADAEGFLGATPMRFALIVCVAALHHFNEPKALGLMKGALSSRGRLLILDLYKQKTIAEFLLSALASAANPMMMLIRRGRISITEQEREAWREHFRYDDYLTMREIREASAKALGKAEIHRLLFWRYSLKYKNGEA
jgi:ubiquinone/menaquinone biosynthesis C-methylase UbiE